MTGKTPTWAVVATVDEPAAMVQAFVAWHLAQGAAHVFVYCDRPQDPVIDILADLAQVTVIPCDEAHWLHLGKSRPRRHQVRQVRNARDAYDRTDATWILHCDADEFVWTGTSVSEVLATVDPAKDCLAVPVAERVHRASDRNATIFEGAFRRPFRGSPKQGRQAFGADYDLTYRGLTGHAQGKAFVRTGRGLQMSVHRPRPGRGRQDVALERAQPAALELLHFEGLTPRFWTYKLARMLHALAERDGMPPSPHRRRQADALLADPTGAERLYQRLKCPTTDQQRALVQHDLWAEIPFDPAAAVAAHFPDQPYDARPAVIEAWLDKKKAWLLRYLGA